MVSFSSSTPVSGDDAVLQVVMLPLDLLVPFGMIGACRIHQCWYDITTSTTAISKSNAPSIAGAGAAAGAAAVFSCASYLCTTQQAFHELGTHLVILLYHTVVYNSYILHPIAILHLVLHFARYKHLVLHLTTHQHLVLYLAPRTDCTWHIVPHLVPTVFRVSVL